MIIANEERNRTWKKRISSISQRRMRKEDDRMREDNDRMLEDIRAS